jgi:hypothetical protein
MAKQARCSLEVFAQLLSPKHRSCAVDLSMLRWDKCNTIVGYVIAWGLHICRWL